MEKNIRDYSIAALKSEIAGMGEPSYRAEQVFRWVYGQRVEDFSAMGNLPAGLRKKLSEKFSVGAPAVLRRLGGLDGTEKLLFSLPDGSLTESVFLPYAGRNTICLSTQVGCRFGCKFCASGRLGFTRNLSPGEISGQIIGAEQLIDAKITNAVFMGIGEPFDNYDNLCDAIRIINHPAGICLSARKMTVSTAGHAPGIKKFSGFDMPVKLAVSLHAPSQEIRSRIMPIAVKYPLETLVRSMEAFRKTGRKLTIEYAMMRGVNDSGGMALKLSGIAKRLDCMVNIISFNEVKDAPYAPAPENRVKRFMDILHSEKIMVSLRRSRGAEINAACGQLAGENNREV